MQNYFFTIKSRFQTALKKIFPEKVWGRIEAVYHFTLAFLAALLYRFPSRRIFVIGVTGTKGKTTVAELLSAILEEAGYKTAVSNTVRFKIGAESYDNTMKMTMPGRFFLQRFLRRAVRERCGYAIIETTSEGARQFRDRFIELNALIFTNLAPEHIESHGSYEKYRDAKLSIAKRILKSRKKRRFLVVNRDDKEAPAFLNIGVPETYGFSLADAMPYTVKKEGVSLSVRDIPIHSKLSGIFNIYNMLAAATCAEHLGIGADTVARAFSKFSGIPGRMEKIDLGQDFTVIVDYAHTPDSLLKVYEVFQNAKKICVLGGTGGGRDAWKRPEMGKIADAYCSKIILTNEDPYDENPMEIVHTIKEGIRRPVAEIIIDRREAIRKALESAETGDVVIITGKGSDPYIMGPSGTRLPWSDALVAREELAKMLAA